MKALFSWRRWLVLRPK